jgi:hypothetical protein
MGMKGYLLLLLVVTLITLSSNSVMAQSKATTGFEKLKSLVGEWEGKAQDGRQLNVTYQIVSGGSALIETLQSANEPSMVTLYHLDGDRLMATHYCSAGNQPRMLTQPTAGELKDLDFKFVDVTNLAKPKAGHMRNLAVTFEDKDHIKQVWTFRMDGKDEKTTFNLERKK